MNLGADLRHAFMRISLGGVLGGIAALIVAAVCIRLGFWQLDRLEQRQSFNERAAAALALPPLRLDPATVARIESDPAAFVLRRATLAGTPVPSGSIVLRGRSHEGGPGVHLVSMFALEEVDRTVLVNRGWVPSPDAATLDPSAYELDGRTEFEGVLQMVPAAGSEAAPVAIELPDTTVTTYRRLDYQTLAARTSAPLLPLYLEVVPRASNSAPPIPVPLPTFDEGPHLGYAIQWFSFGAIAVIGYIVLVVLRSRRDSETPGPRREAY